MRRTPFHRMRLQARRIQQLLRTPGFDPMPNKRVEAAIVAAMSDLSDTIGPLQAMQFAIEQVAAKLPRYSCRYRAPKPSKSDCPKYRKFGACPA